MNCQIKILKDWEKIPLIKNDWDRLVVLNKESTLFQHYLWYEAWYNSFKNFYKPLIIVISHQDKVIGLGAFMINESKEIEFLGSPETEYQDFIYDPDYPQAIEIILNQLFNNYSNYIIKLWEIPSVKSLAHILNKNLITNKKLYIKQITGTYQCRLRKKLNKKDARHKSNKLSKLGNIEYQKHNHQLSEKFNLLDQYFSWLGARFSKSLSRYRKRQLSSEYKNFCKYLIQYFDGQDNKPEVYMENLTLNGEPIAVDQNIHYKNILYGIMRSYNPDYKPFSPGSILLQNSLNSWLDRGTFICDFLRGDEEYKMRYVNTYTELSRFTIYPTQFKRNLAGIQSLIEKSLKPYIFSIYSIFTKIKKVSLKKLTKQIIFAAIWYSGLAFIYLKITKYRCRILCYHSVSDDPYRDKILSVSSHCFTKQVQYIKHLRQQGFVVDITFDDGYQDNYLNAYPILRKEEVKAVIFPTLDFIGNNVHGWHGGLSQPALTWEQINEMRNSGVITFGSHTMTHPDLAKLDQEQVIKELLAPIAKFKAPLLAYPFGKKANYSNEVIEIAKGLGYKRGYTIEEGTNGKNVNLFAYKRLVIFDEPMFMFKTRVSGIIDDFLNLFKR